MAIKHPDEVVAHLQRLAARASGDVPDQSLLERFVAHQDPTAFAALVDRHAAMVLGVCPRILKCEQDAEDACQAAFLVLARRAGSIRKQASVGSWLHGVALRIARRLKADLARRHAPESPLTEEPPSQPSHEPSLREALAVLDEELSRLPERYRAPLVLCYLEGKSRDEAAHVLGWTAGTLHGRLERGRLRLRSRLVRRGIAPSAGLLAIVFTEGGASAAPSILPIVSFGRELPARVVALAEGAIRAMRTLRLAVTATLALVAILLGTGAGVLAFHSQFEEQAPDLQTAETHPAPEPPKDAEPPKEKLPPPGDNGGRPDLLPVRARWRTFPGDVKGVRVDNRGRPWFEIDGYPTLVEIKRQVEKASKLASPWVKGAQILQHDRAGRVWLRPAINPGLLLGFDPRTERWIERRADVGQDPARRNSRQLIFTPSTFESKPGRLYFSDNLGVHVLDGERWDYQPLYRLNIERGLYHDTTHAFDEPRFCEMAGRVFVWTSWGRYGWTGTVGYFIHDGKTWEQRLVRELGPGKPRNTPDDPDLNRLSSVLPLTGERVLVCPQSGAALMMSTRSAKLTEADHKQIEEDISALGHTTFRIREAAHERLARLGHPALPLLREGLKKHTDQEILSRLKRLVAAAELDLQRPQLDGHQLYHTNVLGTDSNGRAWLWFDRDVGPDGREERRGFRRVTPEGKVLPAPADSADWYPDSLFAEPGGRVYLARYRRGCIAFDGDRLVRVTDETQTSLRYVLGRDSEGRVYLSDERRLHAYLPDAPETRASLPTSSFDMPWSENDVALDTRGRLWAFVLDRANPSRGTMSVFEKGAWRAARLPAGQGEPESLICLLPLKDGRLIAQDSNRRAYYCDGDAWHAHASIRELVEKRHAELAKLLDNRQSSRHSRTLLRVDAGGRIWLGEGNDGAVWDGRRWLDLASPLKDALRGQFDGVVFLLPLPRAEEMLAVDALHNAPLRLRVEDGKLKATRFALSGQVRVDNDYTTRTGAWFDGSRLWIPRDHRSCVRIDDRGVHELADTGFPRLTDSRGLSWFHDFARRRLVVLAPDGQRAELSDDTLGMEGVCVAEDPAGLIWVGTDRGLLSVSCTTSAKGIVLRRERLYEKDVPRGSCLLLTVDREHNLWFYGPAPDRGSRLYRVQLPPQP